MGFIKLFNKLLNNNDLFSCFFKVKKSIKLKKRLKILFLKLTNGKIVCERAFNSQRNAISKFTLKLDIARLVRI